MKALTAILMATLLCWGSWSKASDTDDIKKVDSCIDAYSAHLKGERWSIYGGTTGVGVLICVTPGILIYPFFSSSVTTMAEKKMSHISDGRQLLMEGQLRSGKRLEGFVAEVKKGCGRDISSEEITSRLNKLEEDFSYCRKSITDNNGKKLEFAEPWTYEDIRLEMILFFKK